MPLVQYGVAIGTFVSFARDPQDQYGRWYHGHLTIATPEGLYGSALDVDTPSGVGVSYRVSPHLSTSDVGPLGQFSDGWHALSHDSASGALDYLRSPMFQDVALRWRLRQIGPILSELRPRPAAGRPPGPATPAAARCTQSPGCPLPDGMDPASTRYAKLPVLMRAGIESLIPRLRLVRPWVPSTGDNALSALEAQLPSATRIYVFGAHYEQGLGVHDVHMNQGDPAGSQWWSTDGIWQDGAVLLERADATVFGWQVKFNTQSFKTDSDGHPV